MCHSLTVHHHQGKRAAQQAKSKVKKAGMSHPTVISDHPATPLPALHDSKDIQGLSTNLFEPLMDHPPKSSHRVRTAKSGNPHITVVYQSGIFSDWHGFHKPAGSQVGVERTWLWVMFCVPRNHPYPGNRWAWVGMGFYLLNTKQVMEQHVTIQATSPNLL